MKDLNIEKYLNEVDENFAGFYGDARYNDGQYDFVGEMDLDFSGAGGAASSDVLADMPVGTTPSPYQISVSNTTGGVLNMVLFGKNQYLLATNFGSDVGITVTPSYTNVIYSQLLQQSAEQPFETSLIRIQSSNATQVTQILNITSIDANGQECSVPLNTQSYFSANQFQSGILDVPYAIRIDGNTSISSVVLAGTTVVYTFFPKAKVNPSRALSTRPGASAIKDYANPAVPIISPVKPASYNRR